MRAPQGWVVVVFLTQALWLKVIKNERSLRWDKTGWEGGLWAGLQCLRVCMYVCVRSRGGAWALLVTRASFIMSDDINHKADSTKWRSRYEPDLSLVIRLRWSEKHRRKEGDCMRLPTRWFTHLSAFTASTLTEKHFFPLTSPPSTLFLRPSPSLNAHVFFNLFLHFQEWTFLVFWVFLLLSSLYRLTQLFPICPGLPAEHLAEQTANRVTQTNAACVVLCVQFCKHKLKFAFSIFTDCNPKLPLKCDSPALSLW